jgi:hypothetical protein
VLDSGAPAIRQVTFTADGQSTTRAIKDKAGLTSSSRRAATSSTLSSPRACIWICSPSADAREARRRAASREEAFTAYLHRTAPDLAARLRAGHRTSPVTGMLRTPNHIRRAHGSGWALVGDAGYHRDAVTGQGLSDAYRDAELLAAALDQALRGDTDEGTALAGYQNRRDQALRDVFDLTCALADYPPAPEFVALQKQLSVAIDVEAATVAAAPAPRGRELARRSLRPSQVAGPVAPPPHGPEGQSATVLRRPAPAAQWIGMHITQIKGEAKQSGLCARTPTGCHCL